MTEFEFHVTRRMFAARSGNLLVAPPGCPYSHYEWLCGLIGLEAAREWMRDAVRGYRLGPRVVAYRGADFSGRVPLQIVLDVCRVLAALSDLPVTEVGLGAVPGSGQPWLPRTLLPFTAFAARVGTPAGPAAADPPRGADA